MADPFDTVSCCVPVKNKISMIFQLCVRLSGAGVLGRGMRAVVVAGRGYGRRQADILRTQGVHKTDTRETQERHKAGTKQAQSRFEADSRQIRTRLFLQSASAWGQA